jgi:hypothetical protein
MNKVMRISPGATPAIFLAGASLLCTRAKTLLP